MKGFPRVHSYRNQYLYLLKPFIPFFRNYRSLFSLVYLPDNNLFVEATSFLLSDKQG